MDRYIKSFFITLGIYGIIISALLYFTLSSLDTIKPNKQNNLLKVSLIEFQKPQKQAALQHKVQKDEKQKKTKVPKTKKILKMKKPIQKHIKKTPIKPIQKIVSKPKKIIEKAIAKKIEKPKPGQIRKESVVKAEEKKEIKQLPNPIKKNTIVQQTIKPSYSKTQLEQAQKRYFAKIKQTINKNKTYPKIAVRRGIEGLIKIKFTLSKEGELLSYNILKGQRIFKKSVIEAIEKSFPLLPPPNIFTSNIDLFLTLNYKLY